MNPDDHTASVEQSAFFFAQFLSYVLEGVELDEGGEGLTLVVKRWTSIGFALFPEIFRVHFARGDRRRRTFVAGPQMTLNQLARQPLLDCDPRQLKKIADEFMKRFDSQV